MSHAVDGQFQFALDHLVNLFLRMKVFMNGRATLEVVMREGHIRRVEIAPIPARQPLDHGKIVCIDKGHPRILRRIVASRLRS